MIPIPLLVFHLVQSFGSGKDFVNLVTKPNNCVSFNFTKFYTPVNFDKAIWLLYFKSVHFSKKFGRLFISAS